MADVVHLVFIWFCQTMNKTREPAEAVHTLHNGMGADA